MVTTPIADEFQVNEFTDNDQTTPAVALDALGNGVMVWVSDEQDDDDEGIYARRFDANGELGDEFRVNTTTNGSQTSPAVAMNADGSFVVVWQDAALDQSNSGIFAQRYDADGNPLGTEFRVNTTVDQAQDSPAIAIDSAGNFVVTWVSDDQDGDEEGIYAQRFNSAGTPIGDEFRVNTETDDQQDNPQIAMTANGDFIIVWESDDQDGDGAGVYAQRYDSDGDPVGDEFRVNTETSADQDNPAVAMNDRGDVIIAWESTDQDGSGSGIYAQRYDSNGDAVGEEFRVNVENDGNQTSPVVGIDSTGNFIIAWSDDTNGEDGDDLFARQYNNLGQRVGEEFRVNTTTENDQEGLAIAINEAGNVLTVWESSADGNDGDGNGDGIFAQRYNIIRRGVTDPNVVPIRGNGEDNNLRGTNGDDLIIGRRGDDILRGRQGNDTLRGGLGRDTLRGGSGNDELRGNGGDDILRGNSGSDDLNGGGGDDNLRGGGGDDILTGGNGNDTLVGNGGDDIFTGGAGRDTFIGGNGADTFVIVEGRGLDTIRDFRQNDRLGLAEGIRFSDLGRVRQGDDTLLVINDEAAALLIGVSPNEITRENVINL